MATLPEAVWPLNPPVTHVQEASDVTFAVSTPPPFNIHLSGGVGLLIGIYPQENFRKIPNVFNVKINVRGIWKHIRGLPLLPPPEVM